jgi:hypothetical protein
MPGNSRISPQTIDADRAALRAIADMADYAPANIAISAAALQEMETALTQAEQNEERMRRAADVARDQAIEAARRFHDAMQIAKAQVVGQYGHDSAAVEAIGLKKRSDYRRPSRRRGLSAS